ncbi:MAG: glycogen/starch/alpha-glucan phosphorylase [Myxococcota bacterium]
MTSQKSRQVESKRRRVVAEHIQRGTDRTELRDDALQRSFLDHLLYSQGKLPETAHPRDLYMAAAATVRDRLVRGWMNTRQAWFQEDPKRVYYLSLEFLMGRALGNNLLALGIHDSVQRTLAEVGLDLSDILEQEPDAGLGNGGLGRLAACYLDSMATLGLAGMGYGIRYEFGIFDQLIRDGWQVERPEQWLSLGYPWELAHPEYRVRVRFYGRCVDRVDERGRYHVEWVDTQNVVGTPYDTPIVGFRNGTVNTLRLWQARATHEFDLAVFNEGDYVRAVQEKAVSETISKVLYPNDASPEGRELRLKQQYFFVACSLHDIVRRYLRNHQGFAQFPEKVAVQLNDTHPAIAIPELMRLLVDRHDMEWDEAWDITYRTFAYTNHTLLSEALETWTVELVERLLPRHMQIIREIDRRFMRLLDGTKFDTPDHRRRMSIISNGGEPRVRMAHLATVGAHKVNGVAELHTELIKKDLFPDFNALWPDKIVNRTNGVTPRRWLLMANPELSALINEVVGDGWALDLTRLRGLERVADDPQFRARFREVKLGRKRELATRIQRETGVLLDPATMFDVQVKRIHEYKRQLLNIMHAVSLYQAIKSGKAQHRAPRSVIIGGKAAPGYRMAKLIIKLANTVASVVNGDPETRDRLKVVFVPNYRVSLAERIFPGSDLSEQISTAGKEASGTGNMKFALNGALTIGTLDGANIEIREEVGPENFFLFGLTASEVTAQKRAGYQPWKHYEADWRLRAVIDAIAGGAFSPTEPALFRPLIESLMGRDEYMLMADFASYLEAQERVDQVWRDPEAWTRMAILNVARMGKFSSDRAIREYAEGIWDAKPVKVAG